MGMGKWLLLCTALGYGTVLAAQTGQPAGTHSASEPDNAEIVVVAQHREERLQDVPISVSAFSEKTIANLGISAPQDIFRQTPGVRYQSPAGPQGFPIYNIRGVTLLDFSYTSEASIASYRDGVYQGSAALAAQPLYDLERIEILRGPQGTLYGRNSTGGLVHFISAKPTDYFYAKGTLQYGNYSDVLATAAISGPFSEAVRGRLAIRFNMNNGFQVNALDGRRYGSVDGAIAGRGTLEFDLAQDALLTLSAHGSHASGQGDLRTFLGRREPSNPTIECPLARILANQCVNALGIRNPTHDPEIGYLDGTGLPYFHDNYGGYAQLDWTISGTKLTSISAYEHSTKAEMIDSDGTNISPFRNQTYFGTRFHSFSQELRLARDIGRLQLQLGGFYYNDWRFYSFGLPFQGLGDWSEQKIESEAVFLQGTYALTDSLNFTAGGRYTWDDKRITIVGLTGAFQNLTKNGTTLFTFNDRLKDDRFTWRLAMDWHPMQDVMLFASASSGYKLGGYNTTGVASPLVVGPVRSETIKSYEAGVKAELLNRAVSLSLTGFYSIWNDIQASTTIVLPNGNVRSQYSNVGKAHIKGGEAELLIRPIRSLSMNLGASYNDNHIHAPGIIIGGRLIDGNVIANTPKFTANGSINWEPELAMGGKLLFGLDASYQTKVFFRIDNLPSVIQKPYALVDGRLGWTPDDRFRVELFAKNLFNKRYFANGSALSDEAVFHWGMPRIFGVRLTKEF